MASLPHIRRNALMPSTSVVERRSFAIEPGSIEDLMLNYPMVQSEDGALYPSLPPWRTETIPADPWQTRVFRPNGLMVP